MQIHRIGYRVRGFWKITDYAVRLLRMVTESAKRRAKILAFWQKHGEQATLDAFSVCRRTLYDWKRKRAAGLGRMEALNPKSRAPQKRRVRTWPIEIIRMIKIIRTEHPNLGKEKVYPELKAWCDIQRLRCPSIATIGRLIKDTPDGMRSERRFPSCAGRRKMRKPTKRLHKPKGYKSREPLECVGLDSIEKQAFGSRRYIVTFIDLFSRFTFAFGTQSHASKETGRLMNALLGALPHKVGKALTDNGSEFKLEFNRVLKEHGIEHWHTYPRTPKMNAHCERFNRTIQEEFVDHHLHLLFHDLPAFNEKLVDYLIWYNTKRPHKALGMEAPIPYLLNHLTPEECKTGWTHTPTCRVKRCQV